MDHEHAHHASSEHAATDSGWRVAASATAHCLTGCAIGEVLGMVLREEVEIGLMRPIQHADIISAPVYDDELVLVVHRAHSFAARGEILVRAQRQHQRARGWRLRREGDRAVGLGGGGKRGDEGGKSKCGKAAHDISWRAGAVAGSRGRRGFPP